MYKYLQNLVYRKFQYPCLHRLPPPILGAAQHLTFLACKEMDLMSKCDNSSFKVNSKRILNDRKLRIEVEWRPKQILP